MPVDVMTGLVTPETLARRRTEIFVPMQGAKWVAAYKMFDLWPDSCLWRLALWVLYGSGPEPDGCNPDESCEGCPKWAT